mgnify:CR=1 FL=1
MSIGSLHAKGQHPKLQNVKQTFCQVFWKPHFCRCGSSSAPHFAWRRRTSATWWPVCGPRPAQWTLRGSHSWRCPPKLRGPKAQNWVAPWVGHQDPPCPCPCPSHLCLGRGHVSKKKRRQLTGKNGQIWNGIVMWSWLELDHCNMLNVAENSTQLPLPKASPLPPKPSPLPFPKLSKAASRLREGSTLSKLLGAAPFLRTGTSLSWLSRAHQWFHCHRWSPKRDRGIKPTKVKSNRSQIVESKFH